MSHTPRDPPADPLARFTVVERYRADASGSIERVRTADGREAVLKRFTATSATFEAEVAALARIDAPQVTRILDAGALAGGGAWLLREHVDGPTLRAALRALDPERRAALLGDLVAGLAALHREGLIHGDLKPENVFLPARGPARLSDFGLAVSGLDGSEPAAIAGSAFYLPPERIVGWPLDRRADFFSFGVLLYELLGGALPAEAGGFYAKFPREPFLDLMPTDLERAGAGAAAIALVRRLTHADPARRPADAAELLAELAAADLVDPALSRAAARPRLPSDFFVRPLLDAIEKLQDDPRPQRRLVEVADRDEALAIERACVFAAARRGRACVRTSELDDADSTADASRLLVGAATPALLDRLAGAIARGRPWSALLFRFPGDERSAYPWLLPLQAARPDAAALARRLAGRDLGADGAPALPLLRLSEELVRRAGPRARMVDAWLDALEAAGHVRVTPRGVEVAQLDVAWDALASVGALEVPVDARAAAQLLAAADEPLDDATFSALLVRAGLAPLAARAALARAGVVVAAAGGSVLAPEARLPDDPAARAAAHSLLLDHERATRRRPERILRHALHGGALDVAVECVVARRDELARRRADELPRLLEELLQRTSALERGPAELLVAAGELLLKAGRSARAGELFAAAQRDPAVPLPTRLHALRRQGDTALLLGKFEEARGLFESGLERARGSPEELHFARGVGDARLRLGDAAGALALLRSLARRNDSFAPRERLELEPLRALALLRTGALDEAGDVLRQAIAATRPLGHPALLAVLLTNLAVVQWRAGKARVSIETAREALKLQEERGQVHEVAALHQNLGICLVDLARFRDARHHLQTAIELRQALGDARGVAVSRASLGRLALEQGLLAEARGLLDASSADLARLGQPRERLLRDVAELRLRFHSGQWRGLTSALRSLRDAALREAQPDVAAEATQMLFERELAARRYESAADEFARLDGLLAAERDARFAPALALRRVQLKRVVGDVDGALSVVEATRARAAGTPLELEFAIEEIALLGPPPPSDRLEAAERAARASGQRRMLVETLAFRGAWHEARGDRHGAGAALRALRETLEEAVGSSDPATLRRAAAGMIAVRATAIRLAGRGRPGGEDEMTANLHLLRTFLSINRRLAGEADVPRLLDYLVETALSLTGAERGFIVLERDGKTVFEVSRAVRGGEMPAPEKELSTTFLKQSLASGRPLVTSNAGLDPRFRELQSVSQLELRSILCVPIRVDETTRAALYLDHRVREGVFGDREVELTEALADQAGIALRNLHSRQRIETLNRELSQRVDVQASALEIAHRRLDREGHAAEESPEWIGASEAFVAVSRKLERYAATDLTVLVTGESGTGKERAARRLHELSPRRARPFVSESCSAIPETLLEAEFFGVRRGAFTGADADRPGLFELARGGTLFLDEVGEMPPALQAKLLRALEERAVRPLGAREPIAVDLRLVTATNRDLKKLVRDGQFREDLYFRVAAAELPMPPLRERKGDAKLFVAEFLARLNREHGTKRAFTAAALERMDRYAWPGNVRQLRNEVHRAFAVAEGDVLDWQAPLGDLARSDSPLRFPDPMPTLEELERIAIGEALARHGWNKDAAARAIGISRASIYDKARRFDLRPDPGRAGPGS